MTDLLIMKVLEPTAITEAYSNLLNKINSRISIDVQIHKIDCEIEREVALRTVDNTIDGKNEETRKAQRYVLTEQLQKLRNEYIEKLIYAKADIELAQMQIDMHKQVIRYFSTITE